MTCKAYAWQCVITQTHIHAHRLDSRTWIVQRLIIQKGKWRAKAWRIQRKSLSTSCCLHRGSFNLHFSNSTHLSWMGLKCFYMKYDPGEGNQYRLTSVRIKRRLLQGSFAVPDIINKFLNQGIFNPLEHTHKKQKERLHRYTLVSYICRILRGARESLTCDPTRLCEPLCRQPDNDIHHCLSSESLRAIMR